MKQSLSALLQGSIDYAGLFPPAALDMSAAVQAYAEYLRDPNRTMLGRFVVPVVRLREFDDAAAALLPHGDGAEPWHLNALTGPDTAADIELALKFNCRHWSASHIGHAVIDALEIRVSSQPEIASASSLMPRQLTAFFEIPIADDPRALVQEIRRGGGFAKARTGGVTVNAFPAADDIARFMIRCRDERIGFKLTAGLHHPLRARYAFTYDDGAEQGEMCGYLNAFVAATLAWTGADTSVVSEALLSTAATDFCFTDQALSFRHHSVPVTGVVDARDNFIISFGSCSFREPVDELHALSQF